MRRCTYKKYIKNPVTHKSEGSEHYGFFHGFGLDVEYGLDSVTSFSAGIIEADNGQIELVYPPYIKFEDPINKEITDKSQYPCRECESLHHCVLFKIPTCSEYCKQNYKSIRDNYDSNRH